MFEEYKLMVLQAYFDGSKQGTLSLLLTYPTPAKLRDEAVSLLARRYDQADERVLSAFFGKRDTLKDYLKTAEGFDIDKFRPIVNFINGQTKSPDRIVVEMLAWFIDYHPRPFVFNPAEVVGTSEPSAAGEEPEHITEVQPISYPPGTKPKQIRRIVWISSIVLVLVAGSYPIFNHKTQDEIYNGQPCMYWTGDHYRPTACQVKIEDATTYAADPNRIKAFKKILRPDTLTAASIGKVWYINLNGRLEYYTAPGMHPVNTDRKLKPLTSYILNKYAGVP